MNRKASKLDKRAEYIANEVNIRSSKGERVEGVVKSLADSLFLSRATIYRDLNKHNQKTT